MMKIFLATDHAGFELKEKVRAFLQQEGYEVEDCGAYEYDKEDDYPDFIQKAAEAVSHDTSKTGCKAIIFGGSGQGEAMVANKYQNVQAVVYYGGPEQILTLSREHNNANILSLGARFVDDSVLPLIKKWLETPFSKDERHVRRINKMREIECPCCTDCDKDCSEEKL